MRDDPPAAVVRLATVLKARTHERKPPTLHPNNVRQPKSAYNRNWVRK